MMKSTQKAGLTQSEQFLTESLGKSLVPTMLSTLGATVNIFFDGILVGQALGADGFTAVNLCMPIYLLLCTAGSLVGSGGAVLSAHAIGRGDREKSNAVLNTAIRTACIAALLFTVLGLLLMDPIARFLAGGSGLYVDVRAYAASTVLGALPKMLLYIPLLYLRLDGKNLWVTVSTLVMTVLNILLDILFLYGFKTGIGGAAAASVIASLCACVIAFAAFFRSKNFALSLRSKTEPVAGILKSGSPAALNNLMAALRVLGINAILLRALGGVHVSVFSVLNNISEFSLFIVNGIPQAAAPIVGVYSSEYGNGGLRILMKRQLITQTVLSAVFGLVITVFANPIGRLFGVTEPMRFPVFCMAAAVILGGMNSIMIYFYTNSRKIQLANILTVARILVLAVLALLCCIPFGNGVWLFLPVTEIGTMLLLAVLLWLRRRKEKGLSAVLLLDDSRQTSGYILDFSVEATESAICGASERISEFCSTNNLSPKQTMRLGLAIEEILMEMKKHCFADAENNTFDLRAFHMEGNTGIRIRCLGRPFNPFADEQADAFSEEGLGRALIQNIAKTIEYQHILGANCLRLVI